MVEYLHHYPNVEGLSIAAAVETGGENGKKYQSIEGLNSNCLGWTYATNKTAQGYSNDCCEFSHS